MEKVVSVLNTEQEKNNQLLNINLALKDQIIRSKGSIVAFHYIKKQLLEKTNEDILEKVADILNQFLNAETISVYFLENTEKVVRKLQRGKSILDGVFPCIQKKERNFMRYLKRNLL